MDIDTQHQNSDNASDDWAEEKVHEEEGDKLNHNGQVMSNGSVEGKHVVTERVSVEQGRKKKTSVPAWRLVSVFRALNSF